LGVKGSEGRRAKSEKRKAKREDGSRIHLKLRSFGPGRRGPQDDRLENGRGRKGGGKPPHSKKRDPRAGRVPDQVGVNARRPLHEQEKPKNRPEGRPLQWRTRKKRQA